MHTISNNEANELFRKFRDSKVLDIKAGSGTGSIFNIHLLDSLGLPKYIMVYSSWKIVNDENVICTWRDDEPFILKQLISMRNNTLNKIEIVNGGDLILSIGELYRFIVFSDGDIDESGFISDYFMQSQGLIISCLRGKFYLESEN